MKPLRVFLSGKIKDNPTAREDFESAESLVKEIFPQAYVINPFKRVPAHLSYLNQMRECFALIESCDTLVMLNNFIESNGARSEFNAGMSTKKRIILLKDLEFIRSYNDNKRR